jgi:transposase
MEKTQPQLISSAAYAPVRGENATPFSQQTVVLTKQDYIALKWEANYWRAQHARLAQREAALKAQVEALEAQIRDLTQRLYGKKSEKSAGSEALSTSPMATPRKRGQQPGFQGHGRSDRSMLPVVVEVHDLSETSKHCPQCGEALAPFPGVEACDVIEVQVQAHIRRIQRPRYQKVCGCAQLPGIVMAPPAPRVIPKSPLGVSVWAMVLLDKYLYNRPTHRLCQELAHHGFHLSPGTITDGLQRLQELFEPLMPVLYERQMTEKLFHGDETRWEVFQESEGKTGHRWYLWVMQSVSVVYYRMAPGRGADVPKEHFAKLQKDLLKVVLVCDRYSAYKSLALDCEELLLAFCWVHVRRDFLKAARSWPELEGWMFTWVDNIRELYRLNAARLEHWDKQLPLDQQASAFIECQHLLKTKLSEMQQRCEAHLQESDLHLAQQKVLSSLRHHWDGLTVFVERPEVTMDNNTAERNLRTPVVGRKNYYGSGSVWSAHFAAIMFSVLQTILLWGLNPHHWLRAFLQACAERGGESPGDLRPFVPWQMSAERREALSGPLPTMVPALGGLAQERREPEGANTSSSQP